jgi:hypothetical protein
LLERYCKYFTNQVLVLLLVVFVLECSFTFAILVKKFEKKNRVLLFIDHQLLLLFSPILFCAITSLCCCRSSIINLMSEHLNFRLHKLYIYLSSLKHYLQQQKNEHRSPIFCGIIILLYITLKTTNFYLLMYCLFVIFY